MYRENLKHEKHITLPVPSRASIFGVPLEELMGYEGEKGGVPRVVRDCIQFLRDTGLPVPSSSYEYHLIYRSLGMEQEGLFRRSPASVLLRAAQEAYDRGKYLLLVCVFRQSSTHPSLGHMVFLETFGDPHLAAVLLKKYLRDLPEPIFPESLYPVIRRCPPCTNDPTDMSSVVYIRETLLPELMPCVYILLSQILRSSCVYLVSAGLNLIYRVSQI